MLSAARDATISPISQSNALLALPCAPNRGYFSRPTMQGEGALGYQLISVSPNMEQAVSRSLGLHGIDHEWFRVRRRVIHRGKLAHRIQPLFPGYVFVIARYLYQLIERIWGVRGFVRFGGVIEEIHERVVNGLRLRAGPSCILNEDALPFRDGDRCSVKLGGQLTEAIFRSYLTPARAAVDAPMFGGICSVTVRLGDLRPV